MIDFRFKDFETPRFAYFFPSERGMDNEYYRNTNIHMFTEDLSLAIMPIGGRSINNQNFEAHIQGDLKSIYSVREMLKSISSRRHYHRDQDLICSAVTEIVKHMALDGFENYEILTDGDLYKLHPFTKKHTYFFFGLIFQAIPKADRETFKRSYSIGLNRHIWNISMPEQLGGKSGYCKLLKKISKFSDTGPEFFTRSLMRGEGLKNYDAKSYDKSKKAYFWSITNELGWSYRESTLEYSTDFYLCHRNMRFNLTQAIIREHIIDEFNKLFSRLNVNASIEIKGLPSSSKIRKIIHRVEKGEVSLSESLQLTKSN